MKAHPFHRLCAFWIQGIAFTGNRSILAADIVERTPNLARQYSRLETAPGTDRVMKQVGSFTGTAAILIFDRCSNCKFSMLSCCDKKNRRREETALGLALTTEAKKIIMSL